MSSDTTCLVLKRKAGHYQVAIVQAVEDIIDRMDEDVIKHFFDEKPKFNNATLALEEAKRLCYEHEMDLGLPVEYGIIFYTEGENNETN